MLLQLQYVGSKFVLEDSCRIHSFIIHYVLGSLDLQTGIITTNIEFTYTNLLVRIIGLWSVTLLIVYKLHLSLNSQIEVTLIFELARSVQPSRVNIFHFLRNGTRLGKSNTEMELLTKHTDFGQQLVAMFTFPHEMMRRRLADGLLMLLVVTRCCQVWPGVTMWPGVSRYSVLA